MKQEVFYLVLGRAHEVATRKTAAPCALAVFDSIELAIDFARPLVGFQIYCGELNDFSGAELIVRCSSPGAIEWVGTSARRRDFESLFGIGPAQESARDREDSIEEEEHLDWQV